MTIKQLRCRRPAPADPDPAHGYRLRPSDPLPRELIDIIIDGLEDDREALKACALTCRPWLHRSRYHLHRRATLYHQNCRIHPSQVKSVAALSSLPAITEYTRELLLEGKTDYGELQSHKLDHADNGELFWRALARFTHVKKLRVSRLFWVSHTLQAKNRLCKAFPSVTELDVYMSDFADATEFLSFLASFPRLVRLRTERLFWAKNTGEWYEASGSDPSSYRTLPKGAVPGKCLRHIQVQHCDVPMMTDISRWLSTVPNCNISTLHLSPPDGDDFAGLPLFFSAIGTSLKHLKLTLEFASKQETMRRAVASLDSSAQLESVTFLANYGLGRKFVKAATVFWPCVLAILNQVTTDCLGAIRFDCQIEDLDDPATAELDELLTQVDFGALQTVTIAIADSTGHTPEQLSMIAQAALPRADTRRILRVL